MSHLRQAVQDSGLAQVEIAARLNKRPAYLSKVLNGHQALTLIEIRDICVAADINFLRWVTRLNRALEQRAKEMQEQ